MLVRDQEAGGSNPLAPTKFLKNLQTLPHSNECSSFDPTPTRTLDPGGRCRRILIDLLLTTSTTPCSVPRFPGHPYQWQSGWHCYGICRNICLGGVGVPGTASQAIQEWTEPGSAHTARL